MTDQAFPSSRGNQSSGPTRVLNAPPILATSRWGAEAPRGELQRISSPKYVAIHHADTANSATTSLDHAMQLSRNIQQWHFERGWSDSGQQFTVSRGGHASEGRTGSWTALRDGTYFIEGAHVGGHNTTAIGIECEGNYTSTLPPQQLYTTLVHLTAYICQQYAIGPDHILAHRQFSGQTTQCCGDSFVAKLPQLREDVAATLASGEIVASPLGPQVPGPSDLYPTIRLGDSGEAVSKLQRLLNDYGFNAGTVDGIFGPLTETAVKNYQEAHGLQVDGIVGPQTWSALRKSNQSKDPGPGSPFSPTLRRDSRGPAVKELQDLLNDFGFSVGTVDGIFGPKTETAVKNYQKARGLEIDGIVGPQTWAALRKNDQLR